MAWQGEARVVPTRLCIEFGCVRPAEKGPRCLAHYRIGRAQADGRRLTSAQRGYMSPAWRATRAALLARDPYCTEPGCTSPSTDAAHVVSRHQGGSDDLDNLRGLCHRHHSRETAARDGGYGNETR